jgi:3D (Asp-Asp-Asp) domain-containing protein
MAGQQVQRVSRPFDTGDVNFGNDRPSRAGSRQPVPLRRRRSFHRRAFRLALLLLGWSLGLILIDDAKAAMPKRVIHMEVTAYCPCTLCCGPNAQGITACGKPVTHNHGRFVAADTAFFNFGTSLSIPGYYGGQDVKVLDRGGAIKGNKLDVFFPTHERAKKWGRQFLDVTVMEEF